MDWILLRKLVLIEHLAMLTNRQTQSYDVEITTTITKIISMQALRGMIIPGAFA